MKSDRCLTSKCAMVKRNFAPGVHGAKSKTRLTEYGTQLREKQKAKRIYGLQERQFSNYYLKAIKKVGDTGEILFQFLELRLDNVVYRLGLVKSRKIGRQTVSHGHFEVNGKKVNVPSYQARPGDVITVRTKSQTSPLFKNLAEDIKKKETPDWLSLDTKTLKGKVTAKPSRKNLDASFDLKLIIEYYSR